MEENESDIRKAWGILHSLQCDFQYLLQEMNFKKLEFHVHALQMIFKHTDTELQKAKNLIKEREAI